MAQLVYQFSAQNDFGSRLIRLFGHGLYSHVDMVLPDGRLQGARSDVLAGVPAGVQIRPANYTSFSATKQVTIPVSYDEYADGMKFANDQLGKPYDSLAILAFAAGRNWRDDDAWFCDEYLARVAEVAKVFKHHLCLAANKMTPCDLLLVLSALIEV